MFERNVIQKRRVATNKKPMILSSKYERMNSSDQQATWPYQEKSHKDYSCPAHQGCDIFGVLGALLCLLENS